MTICFLCSDALQFYREVAARGIVGNRMWVTSLTDPDGYRLDFESDTEVPEGTRLGEVSG